MPRTVIIEFGAGQDEPFSLIHRLRNFGEDVFRKLNAEDGWGETDLSELDRATTHLAITNVKAPKLHRLQAWLLREAKWQNLRIALTVS